MKAIFTILLFSWHSYAHANDSLSRSKRELNERHGCLEDSNQLICQKIQDVTSFEQIGDIFLTTLEISDKEKKSLLNRISTMECCLAIHGDTACIDLNKELKKKAYECQKRLFPKEEEPQEVMDNWIN